MLGKLWVIGVVMMMVWGCVKLLDVVVVLLWFGFYEGFVLLVLLNGWVVGYFNMEQGEGVIKCCIFDFVGQVSGNQVMICMLGLFWLIGWIIVNVVEEVMFSMVYVCDLFGCGLVFLLEIEVGGGIEFDVI